MAAQSPRRGTRAFTVLLAALLVGGLVAPIAASSPAAAQTSDSESCLTSSTYLLTSCAAGDISTTSYDGDAAATQTTLHGMAVSEWESQKAIETILHNYGEDTGTVASLEGRHAIATAYEQGNSSTTADDMARSAIRDYYSQRQVNTLESFEKSQAQYAHIGNISNEDAIHDEFIYNPAMPNDTSGTNYGVNSQFYTGELVNHTYTLANGTEYEYQSAEIEIDYNIDGQYSYQIRYSWSFNATDSPTADYDYRIPNVEPVNVAADGEPTRVDTNGGLVVRNSYVGTSSDPANGLPSQTAGELGMWLDTMGTWENQSATLTSNYVNIASDLYAEMDAGNLDPNELRGAEGMVRYLSGDSNATEGDYRTALHYTLDTSNPNLTETSTMKVHIDGYTGLTWNESVNSTSREPIPTDPMNGTVEGLLFADGVDSVSVNQTYSTTATDNKSFYMVDENGNQTTLIDGNLTVEAIYDADGNEVENATYTDPKYDSYNATDFINYLEENEDVRAAILSDGSDGGGVTIGDLFGGNPAIGIVVVGAIVALFLAGKFS